MVIVIMMVIVNQGRHMQAVRVIVNVTLPMTATLGKIVRTTPALKYIGGVNMVLAYPFPDQERIYVKMMGIA